MAEASSDYLIRVTRVDGKDVLIRPGGLSELSITAEVRDALADSRIGLLSTKAHVIVVVDEVLRRVLYNLKSDVIPSTPTST